MTIGGTKGAGSIWVGIPTKPTALKDPNLEEHMGSVVRALHHIQTRLDVIQGTQSGVSSVLPSGASTPWNNYTATLPVQISSNVISLSGLSGLGALNRLIGMNSTATALEYKVLTGTVNQVNLAHAAGSITLSTPQDIAAASSPTFAGLTLSGLAASRLVATGGGSGLASVANLASWIAGTVNRVTVTDNLNGTITLSGPQDLHSGANPTFAGFTMTGATQGGIAYFGAAAALAYSAAGASGQVVLSGGTGAPTFVSKDSANTANAIVQRDAGGDFGSRHIVLAGSIRVGTTAAAPGASDGALYFDSTHGCEIFNNPLYVSRRRGIIYLQAAQGSVANTTTKTSLLTFGADEGTTTTAAGFFVVGKTIRFTVSGQINTRTSFAETLTLTFESTNHGISSGSAIVTYNVGADLAAATPHQPFNIEIIMTCRSTGTGGTMVVQSVRKHSTSSGTGPVTTHAISHTTPTIAWNTTQGEIFNFFATWGAPADVNNYVKVEHVMLEVLS